LKGEQCFHFVPQLVIAAAGVIEKSSQAFGPALCRRLEYLLYTPPSFRGHLFILLFKQSSGHTLNASVGASVFQVKVQQRLNPMPQRFVVAAGLRQKIFALSDWASQRRSAKFFDLSPLIAFHSSCLQRALL
jgi:hypothetical protein